MAREVPLFVQELLVENLVTDLQKGYYVSTATNARNIIRIGRESYLRPEVMSMAQRTVNILEEKGYSERRFLDEMAQLALQNPPCPPDSVPVQADGTCPPDYLPLFSDMSDPKTRRCCAKMQQEQAKMQTELQDMYTRLPDDQRVRIDFEKRFMLKDAKTKADYDEMVGAGITPHISQFMQRYKASEQETLVKKLDEIDKRQVTPQSVLGESVSDTLYRSLRTLLVTPVDFALWWVNHDWTRWWIVIYIFRWVALFGCMFLRAADVTTSFKNFMMEVAKQKFGITAAWEYVRQALLPTVMAMVISSSFFTLLSNGAISFGGWLTSVLGSAQLVARFMSVFSQVGFTLDLYFVLRDMGSFALAFSKGVGAELAAWNLNPLELGVAGLYRGTEDYCNRTLRTFLAIVSNMVGNATSQMFIMICQVLFKIFNSVVMPEMATKAMEFIAFHTGYEGTMCATLQHFIQLALHFSGQTPPPVDGAGQPIPEDLVSWVNRAAQVGHGVTNMGLLGERVTGTRPPAAAGLPPT